MLVITNGRLRSGLEDSTIKMLEAAVRTKIGMVRWLDQQDDEALRNTILKLMSRIESEQTPDGGSDEVN
jgi:hypothetical protein